MKSVYLVLIAAVLYLACLTTIVHKGVFYSTDGGVKYITVKQISEGYNYKYIHLAQPSWVQSIWQAGFFPLRPPFVYPSPGGYISVFPPAFQLANAYLYSWWGYDGLYVLPILSILLLWFFTVMLLKRLGIPPVKIALALFILAFCSPVTIYGAMFWEHGPATLLLLAGLALIVRPPGRLWVAVALGLASGAAIWLRPEAIMLDFLYGLAALILYWRERRGAYLGFIAGIVVALGSFMAFNHVVYGNVLGLHGQQLTDPNDLDDHLSVRKSFYVLMMTNYKEFRHFGLTLLVFPILYRLYRLREKNWRPALLGAIVVVFSVVTPFFLPNDGGRQWGVRYFLPLIPIMLVLLFLIDQKWGILDRRYRLPSWAVVCIFLIAAYSFIHNTFSGGIKNLTWAYRGRVLPTEQRFEKKNGNVVVVSDPYMVYELGFLFDKNYFFVATGDDSLHRLVGMLKANGVREYTYIFNPRNPGSQPKSLRDSSTFYLWALAAGKRTEEEFYCTKYSIQ